jgi:hypothetical protein
MTDEKIEVISYSGSRTEETPRAFFLANTRVDIAEILDAWIEEGLNDTTRRRFFKVRGTCGTVYRIYRDEKTHVWHRVAK